MSQAKQMKLGDAMSLEKALAELNRIVEALEEGNLSLEKSLELYQEGVKLASMCRLKLDTAQKKIELLKKGEDGDLFCEAFEVSLDKEDDEDNEHQF